LTFIYVTHDQEEALTMSDRLAVMNAGRIEQLGRPQDVYEEPETTFVAGFLGISNLIRGFARSAGGDRCSVSVGEFELQVEGASAAGPTKLMIRPERVRIEPHGSSGENRLPGIVERVVYRGNAEQVFIRVAGGDQLQALVQNAGDERQYQAGDAVRVNLPARALRALADTEAHGGGDEAVNEGSKDLVSTEQSGIRGGSDASHQST
jgi:spermidine/putrescine transport system ATP-binding protein